MPNYPDSVLLRKMTHVAYGLWQAVDMADTHLACAIAATDDAASKYTLTDFVPRDIVVAAQEMESAQRRLQQFDKHLAQLLTLRGQLAEATGIPMFSHITAEARYPDRETLDM